MKVALFTSKAIMFMIILWGIDAIATPMFAKEVTLEDLVREVKVALLRVQQHAERDQLPPLATAELELNTVQSTEGSGKISFLIVEIGGEASKEFTHSVKLTLTPPSPKSSSDVTSVLLADALAESILAGARAISAAKKGSPPLHAKELKAVVKFALKRDAEGKLSISFPPFEIGTGASVSASAIQSITVTYKYK